MTHIQWHGFDAWHLENDQISVVIVPALGAKIASLVDKAGGYEWLAPPTNPPRQRTYGDTFTDHDLAGWDEMFPTIEACPSPFDDNTLLPDHGEVWALPWDVIEDNPVSLVLRVVGKAMNYTLTRTATLLPTGLRLDYALENHTPHDMPFLWAAHPLFNGDENTRIILPESISQVVSVVEHPVWALGEYFSWPKTTLDSGEARQLDIVGQAVTKDYRKFYARPVSTAELVQSDVGRALRLAWTRGIAPYLGIWVDEGTYTQTTTVALEPATGFYDSLSRAISNDRVATVGVGQVADWSLIAQFDAVGS